MLFHVVASIFQTKTLEKPNHSSTSYLRHVQNGQDSLVLCKRTIKKIVSSEDAMRTDDMLVFNMKRSTDTSFANRDVPEIK